MPCPAGSGGYPGRHCDPGGAAALAAPAAAGARPPARRAGGVGLGFGLHQFGVDVATIGSKFSYTLADGSQGMGIPPIAPTLVMPWALPGPDGSPVEWNLAAIERLLPAAFSMAMLGAIESLLCAVVLDGMTGRKHSSNAELVGQGLAT